MEDKKIDTIYHYCSLETFMSIIQNKTLRLCDINKTNDYQEKIWGIHLLEKTLNRALHSYGIEMNLLENYWYSESAHNHIDELKNEVKMILNKQTLISCFSTNGDQLSQWRAYGQDGQGISIGFNYKILSKILKKEKEIYIEKVIYSEKLQENTIINRAYIPALRYVENMYTYDPVSVNYDFNEYFIEEFDSFCEVLDDYIEKIFPLLKNPAFNEEKECRIVYNTNIYDEIDKNEYDRIANKGKQFGFEKEIELSKINYSLKGNRIVAYADMNFGKCIDKGIIKEIVIGPKAEVIDKDLNYFLYSNGFDEGIIVRKSEASYK